ncbi:hypothetical protein M885DRAFT_455672, partial [Pelagophyceae sp. CCMP2097]
MQRLVALPRSARRLSTLPMRGAAELVVRNLPPDCDEATVRGAFAPFKAVCDVMSVTIPYDKAGVQRGFAFVTIETAAWEAVSGDLDGAEIVAGRRIAVELLGWSSAPKAPAEGPTRREKVAAKEEMRQTGRSVAVALNKRLVTASTAHQVLALFEAHGADYDYMNFSTSFHKLGTLSRDLVELTSISASSAWSTSDSTSTLDAFAADVVVNLKDDGRKWSPQGLSNVVWGAAKVGHVDPKLFDAVSALAPQKIQHFDPQALANTVWAFAKVDCPAPLLFEAVSWEATKKVGKFSPQALANTVWAYARARHASPVLFDAVANEVLKKVTSLKPQALANIVWAYAKAGVPAQALFDVVAEQAYVKISMFNAQDLATTAWAFAKAGVRAPSLFQAVAIESQKKMNTFDSQTLASTAWAYAHAQVEAPTLFAALADESVRRMETFNAQALVNVAWAFATAGVEAPKLFEAVAANVPRE